MMATLLGKEKFRKGQMNILNVMMVKRLQLKTGLLH
jgi:hypothetical protein